MEVWDQRNLPCMLPLCTSARRVFQPRDGLGNYAERVLRKMGTAVAGKWDDCALKAGQTPVGLGITQGSRLLFIDESIGAIRSSGRGTRKQFTWTYTLGLYRKCPEPTFPPSSAFTCRGIYDRDLTFIDNLTASVQLPDC
jgi:hypothetical protein